MDGRGLQLVETFGNATEYSVTKLETALGVRFPLAYRSWLLETGGGWCFGWSRIQGRERWHLRTCFAVDHPQDFYTIAQETASAHHQALPRHMIVIATDGFGRVAIDTQSGNILTFSQADGASHIRSLEIVASNWLDFLSQHEPDTDDLQRYHPHRPRPDAGYAPMRAYLREHATLGILHTMAAADYGSHTDEHLAGLQSFLQSEGWPLFQHDGGYIWECWALCRHSMNQWDPGKPLTKLICYFGLLTDGLLRDLHVFHNNVDADDVPGLVHDVCLFGPDVASDFFRLVDWSIQWMPPDTRRRAWIDVIQRRDKLISRAGLGST